MGHASYTEVFSSLSSLSLSPTEISCDTAIRDWVLIPLSIVMVLIGVLRYFVYKLMRSPPTPDAKIVKEGARNLKAGANFIPHKSF
ncbi:unnamed protein product [Eruca vesicaria subsp. sativa]|uniref:ER membrane protein complex subunit 3 n=1 Tax=Eruca vesicaria subsp. sativa TaxID=29727 RepID=A0ABC8JRL6_ERUVS|nr:unnamed protein product [Eruca vesicaria subsp. sativa]